MCYILSWKLDLDFRFLFFSVISCTARHSGLMRFHFAQYDVILSSEFVWFCANHQPLTTASLYPYLGSGGTRNFSFEKRVSSLGKAGIPEDLLEHGGWCSFHLEGHSGKEKLHKASHLFRFSKHKALPPQKTNLETVLNFIFTNLFNIFTFSFTKGGSYIIMRESSIWLRLHEIIYRVSIRKRY